MIIQKKKILLKIAAVFTVITMLPMLTFAQTASDGHTDHMHAPVSETAAGGDGHTDHTHGEAVVGGVGDGHTDHTHAAGGSDLLQAWSSRWWGLLAVATLLTLGLSLGVWRYLQVEPIKKATAPSTEVKK
jgi:hypothetical protein